MWHLKRRVELIVNASAFRYIYIYIYRFITTKTMIISFMKAIHTNYFRNYEFLMLVDK